MLENQVGRRNRELAELLASRSWWLAVAESCTGGLLGSTITDVPGSSAYFSGGVIAYSDDVKINFLGVPKDLIAVHGAVSEPVASEMAARCRMLLGADVAIATTGIAGPGGGTACKPVGLVYVAVAVGHGVFVRSHRWAGTRTENKLATVEAALRLAVEAIAGDTGEA